MVDLLRDGGEGAVDGWLYLEEGGQDDEDWKRGRVRRWEDFSLLFLVIPALSPVLDTSLKVGVSPGMILPFC